MKKTILFYSALLLWSCGSDVKKSQLIGAYVSAKFVNDTIAINDDGTYVHNFKNEYGKNFVQSGKWSFREMGQEIVFRNFMDLGEDGANQLGSGSWYSKVKNIDGEVGLIYSSEDNIYYHKIK